MSHVLLSRFAASSSGQRLASLVTASRSRLAGVAGQTSVEWVALAIVVSVFGIIISGNLDGAATQVGTTLKGLISALGDKGSTTISGAAASGGSQGFRDAADLAGQAVQPVPR